MDLDLYLSAEEGNIELNTLQQAIALKAHFKLISQRIEILEKDLASVYIESEELDSKLQECKEKNKSQQSDLDSKKKAVLQRHENSKIELCNQLSLSTEILSKKVEENKCLLKYLKNVEFGNCFPDELRNFDKWNLFKRFNESQKKNQLIGEKHDKARTLHLMNEHYRRIFENIKQNMVTTDQLNHRISLRHLRKVHDDWLGLETEQASTLRKISKNTSQLNNLIIQCAGSERIPETMTQHIRNKCVSFVTSNNGQDLLNGLVKYKKRLETLLYTLKQEESVISKEVNQLTFIKDQTIDQTKYYTNIIDAKKRKIVYENATALD